MESKRNNSVSLSEPAPVPDMETIHETDDASESSSVSDNTSDGHTSLKNDENVNSSSVKSSDSSNTSTIPPMGRRRSIIKDPASKPTLHKKTVSFSRLPCESLIKNAADCVTLMQNGHQFVKMRSNARIYNRFYWFDVTSNCLRWEPSKKDQGKAKIDITSVREVRPGKATELFLSSEISSHFPEECAFSIIYGDYKNLDLIAGSVDEANIWITGLRCLLGGQNPEELQTRKDTRDSWLSSVFESADINSDGFLDEEESLELLKSLSDGIRQSRIKQKLTEFLRFKDRDRTRLSKEEFVELFKDVTTRPEIYFLLARHASGEDYLTVDDLLLFLESEQGLTDVTQESCISIIERYEPSSELKAIPAFGINGFTKYLMSRECNIFDPSHAQVCQNMNQPLSHYYIASSHNTYLMEDQISGPSSVSAYVRALLRCCRCIELDCWDGEDGQPVISHGHTQSNSISFEQTIEAIKECAFKNSPYPVILCIENHCSVTQQKIIAKILKSVLGDKIYTKSLDEDTEYLPSPESLKYHFLIKGKKLPSGCVDDEGDVSDEDEGAEINEKTPPSPIAKSSVFSIGPGILMARKSQSKEVSPSPKRKLSQELSDLVSLCVSVRVSDSDSFAISGRTSCSEFTSIHERVASNLAGMSPEEFVNYNKKYLTRVHPSAVRVDSSNFNPQDFWNCGVQIASLNYQTPGLMMDINDGRFAMNGGCGYVLKPAIMRDEVAYFSASQDDVIPSIAPKILHLRIISGQEFPKPRGGGAKGQVIDPYVLIELFGMPSDCSEQRTRTAHDCGSGNSTALFDESFEFRLTIPDLALVRFVVLDDEFIGDEFIGQYTIPFECMQLGYRHLRLRSIFDEPLDDATLFVHIAVSDGNMPLTHSMSLPTMVNSVNATNQSSPNMGSLSSSSFKLSSKRSSSSALLKKSKKAQQQQQARRERAAAMRVLGVKKIDDTFKTASHPLKEAAEMRENLHHSLVFFKEVCGLSPLSSAKQCIRNLATRVSVELQQTVGGKKLTRKVSTEVDGALPLNGIGSQAKSSPSTKGLATKTLSDTTFNRSDSTKLSLIMSIKDDCLILEIPNLINQAPSACDMWRKVLAGFQALVTDAKHVLDNATKCHESLTAIHKEALKHHEQLSSLLSEAYGVAVDSPQSTSSPSTQKKLKKKLAKSERPKRISLGTVNPSKNIEWDFAWNCSVVRGHSELLKSTYKEAEQLIAHLWDAGLACGLVYKEMLKRSPLPRRNPITLCEPPTFSLSSSDAESVSIKSPLSAVPESRGDSNGSMKHNGVAEGDDLVKTNKNNNNNLNVESSTRDKELDFNVSCPSMTRLPATNLDNLVIFKKSSSCGSLGTSYLSHHTEAVTQAPVTHIGDPSKSNVNKQLNNESLPMTTL